jgi:putative nucleotidyltransferase with HDIG domain
MAATEGEHFITVDQLQPGIFVCLDLGWMDHPFSTSSFKIKSVEQINTIKGLNLKRVRYDPAKSDTRPLPIVTEPVAPPIVETTAAVVVEDNPAIAAKRQLLEKLSKQREAMARVEKQFVNAGNVVRNISKNIFSRPQETIKDAADLIQQIADSMLDDMDVTLHVMGDKVGSEEVYFHALNTTVLSLMLAREMKLPQDQLKTLGMAAMFHDIGKTQIPDKITRKLDPLTKPEMTFLQQHSQFGADIARKSGLPPNVVEIVFQHHELFDGSGYPQGLRGEKISKLASVLCIVNVYDNLCNHINIANSLTPHEALSLMFSQQRSKYDALPLGIFIRCMGVYPPGTVVKLSNDALGMVTMVNLARPLKPVVVVYDAQVPKEQAIILDLDTEPDLNISKAIRPGLLPRNVYDYLSPRKRISYYFDSQQKSGSGGAKMS